MHARGKSDYNTNNKSSCFCTRQQSGKVVVFGKRMLYSGEHCGIRAIVVVFGQSG